MAQAILHNITPVAKCCILVRLDSSMVGYDDWDGPFVLPTRTRDIRGFGLDFSERLGREPGDEETESIGISERDDFDKTVCMYHHRNAILVLTLEHSHVISAINHSLSSLTRMVLVLHHRKTLRSFVGVMNLLAPSGMRQCQSGDVFSIITTSVRDGSSYYITSHPSLNVR